MNPFVQNEVLCSPNKIGEGCDTIDRKTWLDEHHHSHHQKLKWNWLNYQNAATQIQVIISSRRMKGTSSTPAKNGIQLNQDHQHVNEVAIELKRGNSPSLVILRVSIAPQGEISSTHLVQRTPQATQLNNRDKPFGQTMLLEEPVQPPSPISAHSILEISTRGHRRKHKGWWASAWGYSSGSQPHGFFPRKIYHETERTQKQQ